MLIVVLVWASRGTRMASAVRSSEPLLARAGRILAIPINEVGALRTRWCAIVCLAFGALSSLPGVAQVGKVEILGALADAAVPEPVRQVLEAKGYRVLLDGSAIAAELWFRKDM